MRKNVFVLRVDGYRPELCRYTLPTIRAWAKRIGADYREITQRTRNDLPVTYEKTQIHELGAGAHWNFVVDADAMIHPEMPDPTRWIGPDHVASSYAFDANRNFKANQYFLRDGRNIGIAGGFVMASHLTHDLWTPLREPHWGLDQIQREHILDEFCFSMNLAKFGLKFQGVLNPEDVDRMIVHIGSESNTEAELAAGVDRARQLFEQWSPWL